MVLGCINAVFREQISVGKLLTRSIIFTSFCTSLLAKIQQIVVNCFRIDLRRREHTFAYLFANFVAIFADLNEKASFAARNACDELVVSLQRVRVLPRRDDAAALPALALRGLLLGLLLVLELQREGVVPVEQLLAPNPSSYQRRLYGIFSVSKPMNEDE